MRRHDVGLWQKLSAMLGITAITKMQATNRVILPLKDWREVVHTEWEFQ